MTLPDSWFIFVICFFFFSSRRRHTRCALVTGVQTCALPIAARSRLPADRQTIQAAIPIRKNRKFQTIGKTHGAGVRSGLMISLYQPSTLAAVIAPPAAEIGRAWCRDRVCQYV